MCHSSVFFAGKNAITTYEDALTYLDRIRDIAIGAYVKGRLIQSLSIGPTAWEEMTEFLNLRIQKGDEVTLIEFSSLSKSLPRYMECQSIMILMYPVGK